MCRGVEAIRKLPREKRKFTHEEKRIIYHKLAHTECIPKNRVQYAKFLMALAIPDLALTSFGRDASGQERWD